jgi:hypothetical protein
MYFGGFKNSLTTSIKSHSSKHLVMDGETMVFKTSCLGYERVQGSQNLHLRINLLILEERGVEERVRFSSKDSRILLQSFTLSLILRLLESTSYIVGITIKCLRSLGVILRLFLVVLLGFQSWVGPSLFHAF